MSRDLNRRLKPQAFLWLLPCVLSSYLLWLSWSGQAVAGCLRGHGCDGILGTPWAQALGMPVSMLSLTLYGFLLIASLKHQPSQSLRNLESTARWIVVLGAVWFIGVQIWVLESYCLWCCLTHATALAALAYSYWCERREKRKPKAWWTVWIAVTAVLTLAYLQTYHADPAKVIASLGPGKFVQEDATLFLHNREVTLKISDYPQSNLPPVSQPQSTPRIEMIVITDWTCSQCRRLTRSLRELSSQMPEGGILILPGVLDDRSREVHRLMLALARSDHALYRQISNKILSEKITPSPIVVAAEIEKSFQGNFRERLLKEEKKIDQLMEQAMILQNRNDEILGESGLPQIMVNGRLILGGATPQ